MAFCKQCGLRLDATVDHCPHCGIIINPVSQEDDFHAAISTMPPEHVLKRRKLFPIRDALYTPLVPEYQRFQQGARVVRKTHWLAYSSLLLVCFLLLICVYNVLSAGFTAFQWLLFPMPNSPLMELTALAAEQTPPPAFQIVFRPTLTPAPHKRAHVRPAPHKRARVKPAPHKRVHVRPAPHKRARVRPHATPMPNITFSLEKARAIISAYYRNINARAYRSAYALWLNNPLDYTAFVRGFAHTQRDIIRFGVLEAQSDTTVHVSLTVQASESFFHHHHTRISLYQGYYLVQHQPDHSWRIIAAGFKRL